MSEAPFGLKAGSVLLDNDARSEGRRIVVKAVAVQNKRWFAYYQGGHRKHRISFDRINEADGKPHSQGYTVLSP
jgi:hypothetical protein